MRVTRLVEDDWDTLRTIRLRSLTEDHPVLASLDRERGFTEAHWRMRLRGSSWFVATQGRRPVGLISLIEEPGAPAHERHVVGLWVAPEARATAAGKGLLGAAVDRARTDGAALLTAWLLDGDEPVEALLRAAGFVASGVRTPFPRDRSLTEERWTRDLAGQRLTVRRPTTH